MTILLIREETCNRHLVLKQLEFNEISCIQDGVHFFICQNQVFKGIQNYTLYTVIVWFNMEARAEQIN